MTPNARRPPLAGRVRNLCGSNREPQCGVVDRKHLKAVISQARLKFLERLKELRCREPFGVFECARHGDDVIPFNTLALV